MDPINNNNHFREIKNDPMETKAVKNRETSLFTSTIESLEAQAEKIRQSLKGRVSKTASEKISSAYNFVTLGLIKFAIAIVSSMKNICSIFSKKDVIEEKVEDQNTSQVSSKKDEIIPSPDIKPAQKLLEKNSNQNSVKEHKKPKKLGKSTINQNFQSIVSDYKNIICEFSQGRLSDIRKSLNISSLLTEDQENKGKNLIPDFDKNNPNHIKFLQELLGFNPVDEDNLGSVACTFIVLEAMKSYFDKGTPHSEKEIYHLINEGVNQYHKKNCHGLQNINELLEKEEKKNLKIIIPELTSISDSQLSESTFNSFFWTDDHEVAAYVNDYLNRVLNYAFKDTIEHHEKRVAVITTAPSNKETPATIALFLEKDKKPAIFNSHGQTYNGKTIGASLLYFDDIESVEQYIKQNLYKNQGGLFQFQLFGKA